jgi:hypothetical protein
MNWDDVQWSETSLTACEKNTYDIGVLTTCSSAMCSYITPTKYKTLSAYK